MEPISTSEGIQIGPEVVIPILAVVVIVVIGAILLRGFLVEAFDGLVDIWRTYGPVAAYRALDRRPGLAATPWFCDRCHSQNGVAATRCYRCGARRDEAEAAVPDADQPAGPSAGLTQRTRRKR